VRVRWGLARITTLLSLAPGLRADLPADAACPVAETGPDRSPDLYSQADNPGPERVSNRLPAHGEFVLFPRLYGPRQQQPSILDGTWKPPAVQKAG
jgi:hypothetical protein